MPADTKKTLRFKPLRLRYETHGRTTRAKTIPETWGVYFCPPLARWQSDAGTEIISGRDIRAGGTWKYDGFVRMVPQ